MRTQKNQGPGLIILSLMQTVIGCVYGFLSNTFDMMFLATFGMGWVFIMCGLVLLFDVRYENAKQQIEL